MLGIRSNSSDHDLSLFNQNPFGDPAGLAVDDSSTFISSVDFVTVDGNHWPSSTAEHYRVYHYSGTGGYNASFSNLGVALSNNGSYGPYSAASDEVAKAFDLFMDRFQFKRLEIVPAAGNNNDLAVELFRSTDSAPATWSQSRGSSVAGSNASSLPGQVESFDYLNDQDSGDWLGLVVYGFLPEPAAYSVRIVCTLNQDIFGDGKVDVSDVQYVASYWAATAPPDRADRDNDGDVDIFDILLVAGEWNTQC